MKVLHWRHYWQKILLRRNVYWQHFIDLNRAAQEKLEWGNRLHIKISVWHCETTCYKHCGKLLVRPRHGSSTPPAVFTRHSSFIAYFSGRSHLFSGTEIQFSFEEQKLSEWLIGWIASKEQYFFSERIRMLPETCGKVKATDRIYFQ